MALECSLSVLNQYTQTSILPLMGELDYTQVYIINWLSCSEIMFSHNLDSSRLKSNTSRYISDSTCAFNMCLQVSSKLQIVVVAFGLYFNTMSIYFPSNLISYTSQTTVLTIGFSFKTVYLSFVSEDKLRRRSNNIFIIRYCYKYFGNPSYATLDRLSNPL